MQLLGGIVAAGLVSAMFPGQLQAGSSLSTPTTLAQGFFIEMMITAELVMTIIMLAVVKSRASFMAPLSIGLALFIGHLIGTCHSTCEHYGLRLPVMNDDSILISIVNVGINYTGASMNPARTLGPAIIDNDFKAYMWIYIVGPFVGSILAAGLYRLLKAMYVPSISPISLFSA